MNPPVRCKDRTGFKICLLAGTVGSAPLPPREKMAALAAAFLGCWNQFCR